MGCGEGDSLILAYGGGYSCPGPQPGQLLALHCTTQRLACGDAVAFHPLGALAQASPHLPWRALRVVKAYYEIVSESNGNVHVGEVGNCTTEVCGFLYGKGISGGMGPGSSGSGVIDAELGKVIGTASAMAANSFCSESEDTSGSDGMELFIGTLMKVSGGIDTTPQDCRRAVGMAVVQCQRLSFKGAGCTQCRPAWTLNRVLGIIVREIPVGTRPAWQDMP